MLALAATRQAQGEKGTAKNVSVETRNLIAQCDYEVGQDNIRPFGLDIHNPMFVVSGLSIIAFVLVTLMFQEGAEAFFGWLRPFLTSTFDWFFLLAGNILVLFCMLLIVTPLCGVRLGGADVRPDVGYLGWFAAGMGIGLMFVGVSEPVSRFGSSLGGMALEDGMRSDWAKLGGAAGDVVAARNRGMAATIFHWALHPWAIYAVAGLALAFLAYNYGLPLTLRSTFYPLFGDAVWGWTGHVIDSLAVFATLFGLATSLGFGTEQALAGRALALEACPSFDVRSRALRPGRERAASCSHPAHRVGGGAAGGYRRRRAGDAPRWRRMGCAVMSCRVMLLILSAVLLLAGCGSKRPEGAVCRGLCAQPGGPTPLIAQEEATGGPGPAAPGIEAMASAAFGEQVRALMRRKADLAPRGVPERALSELPTGEEGRLRLLALSAGGPYGAFGAGFLNGWSQQVPADLARPEAFDVVTGVSAGALLATHAFLGGRVGDAVLEQQYTTISTADVLRERTLLGALFSNALFSNALFDTAPLRRTLERLVTPTLLDQVAAATGVDPGSGQPSRLLLVLAVDLDSGRPRILDLGAIARASADPARLDRYVDALMASSAIPVAFPPVFIDGAMHADGGTRLTLFFNRYLAAERARIVEERIPEPRLDIIVNGEAALRPRCTGNTLTGIAKRSAGVVLDQLALDRLYRAVSEAERDGFLVRYATAEGSGCTPPDDPADMFQQGFLRCLFAFGKALGGGPSPWKAGTADFPAAELGGAGPAAACAAG